MTNVQIIAIEQVQLLSEGILHLMDDGEIQPIHTYATWKSMGYQVKKGEKAVAKFPVWKWLTKKKQEVDLADDADGETLSVFKGKCYMKVAAFFTDEQVERISKEVE